MAEDQPTPRCTVCRTNPPRDGRKLYFRCNNYHVVERARRRAAGLCSCGRERDAAGLKRCAGCRAIEAGRKARRKHAGLCPCGHSAAVAGRKWCQACAAADRRRTLRTIASCKAAGLCVECGKAPARTRRTTCAECGQRQCRSTRRWILSHPDKAVAMWQMNRFRRQQRLLFNGGNFTGAQWQALKAAQGYCCLACGRKEPEIRLTVDHVVPVSKGGPNDIGNLQGLCLACNLRKCVEETDYRHPLITRQLRPQNIQKHAFSANHGSRPSH